MALTMNEIYDVIKTDGGKTPSEKVMDIAKNFPCLLYTSDAADE